MGRRFVSKRQSRRRRRRALAALVTAVFLTVIILILSRNFGDDAEYIVHIYYRDDLSDRLVVMTRNTIDFLRLEPITTDEIWNGIFVLQFASIEDARVAFEYLYSLEYVVWVDNDGFMTWGG